MLKTIGFPQSLDVSLIFLCLCLYVNPSVASLNEAADLIEARESGLDICEREYTSEVSCDYGSLLSIRFGTGREQCHINNQRSKPTDKRKWKSCIVNVNKQFGHGRSYPLQQGNDAEIYSKCLQVIGVTEINSKTHQRVRTSSWYKKWPQLTRCLRTGDANDYSKQKGKENQYLRRELSNGCKNRALEKYSFLNSCLENACAEHASCFNGHELWSQELTSENISRVKPESFDVCFTRVQHCFKQSKSFGGYNCKGDCSGHEAGYNWASDNAYADEDDCEAMDANDSKSFYEGCLVFVYEQ